MKTCDVVMPAYNSEQVLFETLNALASQDVPQGWQARLVLCDDGSVDATPTIPQKVIWGDGWSAPRVVRGRHGGSASARNMGIDVSKADILLFLGSDIVVRSGALAQHLMWHDRNPQETQAALGMVMWDPRIRPTAFMEWMMHGGQQNDFDALLGQQYADPKHFFYGSHISVKRSMMCHFSGEYGEYGWEDLDAGRALAQRGLKLAILHDAIGLHRHFYSARDIFKRQYRVGRSMRVYARKHPDVAVRVSAKTKRKYILYMLARPLIFVMVRIMENVSAPTLYLWATSGEYWRGVLSTEPVDNVNSKFFAKYRKIISIFHT